MDEPGREYLCNFLEPIAETMASGTTEDEDKAPREIGGYCERGEKSRQKQSNAQGSKENAA
jgi:hypothetical protein